MLPVGDLFWSDCWGRVLWPSTVRPPQITWKSSKEHAVIWETRMHYNRNTTNWKEGGRNQFQSIFFYPNIPNYQTLKLVSNYTQSWPKSLPSIFKWFDMISAQASQISASQIKAPVGSVFQKYVYSSLMVKMRIDSGSFGLFWFILCWG